MCVSPSPSVSAALWGCRPGSGVNGVPFVSDAEPAPAASACYAGQLLIRCHRPGIAAKLQHGEVRRGITIGGKNTVGIIAHLLLPLGRQLAHPRCLLLGHADGAGKTAGEESPPGAALGRTVGHVARLGKRIVPVFSGDLFFVLHLTIAARLLLVELSEEGLAVCGNGR